MYSSLEPMWSVKPMYSRACMLMLALPDVFAYPLWMLLQEHWLSPVLHLRAETVFTLLLLWLCISYLSGLYIPPRLISWKYLCHSMAIAAGGQWLAAAALAYLNILPTEVLIPVSLCCGLLIAWTLGSRLLLLGLYRWKSSAPGSRGRFIILGYTPEGRALQAYLKRVGKPHHFMGFFDDAVEDIHIQGKLSEVKDFCRAQHVHVIYVCGGEADYLKELYHFANQEYMYMHYLSPALLPERKMEQNMELEKGLSVWLYPPSRRKRFRKKWVKPRLFKRKLITAPGFKA